MSMIKNENGFTLLELIIVVLIVGIVSAIAIPTFMGFQSSSRQAEVKANLGSLGSTAEAYFAEHESYVTPINLLGWEVNGLARYDYAYNGWTLNYANTSNQVLYNVGEDSAATTTTFLAAAEGNIDNDSGEDCWTFDQNRNLVNTNNDRHLDSLC